MLKIKNKELLKKFNKLKKIILDLKSVVVAFSGGVDSTFLLKVANDVLGDKTLAVIAVSRTYQKKEYKEALCLSDLIGANLKIIKTEELNDAKFINNPPERCYYCKKELFDKMRQIAKDKNYADIVYGATISDIGDFRPGADAAKELGIRAPLMEAGLSKDEIRILSKKLRLPTWNKSAMACLASRFPYGEKITGKKLNNIEKAEEFVNNFGFKNVRVRMHGKMARIEIDKRQIKKILSNSIIDKIVKKFKQLGFTYISLDLEGYRAGSMNEVLTSNKF